MRKRKRVRDDEQQVWVTHYSSNHQILLVGEGDFSFSSSLASCFGSASNIFASSLDSYDDVVRKYKKARSNLETLRRLGAFLLHGVDATKLQLYPDINTRRFDRVIFNFPHAGFHGKESDHYLIQKHRELVFGFFHGASRMLKADGEIHVSHKNKAPYCHWKLEDLASRCSLVLKQRVAFKKGKYPGYENKRGDGSSCDKPFILGDCTTFKFRYSRIAKKAKQRQVKERESEHVSQQRPVSFYLNYHQDHNVRQVQDHLFQSRPRTSPLDLRYYLEQFQDECSSRLNGVSFDMLKRTSVPHPYTAEESLERHRLRASSRRLFWFKLVKNRHQERGRMFVRMGLPHGYIREKATKS